MANRGRQGRTIDFKSWTPIASFSAQTNSETTTAGNGFSVGSTSTILRTRGFVQASMNDSGKAVDDNVLVTFGLGIVSSDAFAVGASALPDPAIDANYPWIWWGEMFLESQSTTNAEGWGISAQRVDVDSKAMRRIQQSQTLAWVIQTSSSAGAPVIDLAIGTTRVLVGT